MLRVLNGKEVFESVKGLTSMYCTISACGLLETFFAAVYLFVSLIKDPSIAFASKLIIQTSVYWWQHTFWIYKQAPLPSYSGMKHACLLERIQCSLSVSDFFCVGFLSLLFSLLIFFISRTATIFKRAGWFLHLLVPTSKVGCLLINFFSCTTSIRISSLFQSVIPHYKCASHVVRLSGEAPIQAWSVIMRLYLNFIE